MRSLLSVLLITLVLSFAVIAQEDEPAKAGPQKPTPDIANGKYGSLERNVFDLWTPKTKQPAPLVVYIHGGGFVNGDKDKLSANLLKRLLDNGVAVMAINYSLMPQYLYPQAYKDAARAIQFARSNAKRYGFRKPIANASFTWPAA